MRKTSAALVSLSLVALALTGCSVTASNTFAGETCDRAASSSGIDESVTVDSDFGVAPDVTVTAPITAGTTAYTDLIVGDGTAITSDKQVFAIDYDFYSGDTGEQLEKTSWDGTGSVTNLATIGASMPGLTEVLACATGGTRIVAAISAADAGGIFINSADTDPSRPVVTEDTPLVVVIDVLDVKRARAEGSLVFNDANNLPTVVRAPDGRPGIIVPKVDAPTEQVVQVLIEGDGAKVTEEDTTTNGVWVDYTSVGWDTRTQIATTWDGNPVASLADVSPTLMAALVGKTIGSQLLVVEPGTDGGSATAYVIDILGATATATATGQ